MTTTFSLISFLLLMCMFSLSVSLSSNFSDQSALLAFKASIILDPNNATSNWTNTNNSNFCNWFGVSCSKSRQRVVALNLTGLGLSGTISPYIGNLSFIKGIYLSNNSFGGNIPLQLFHLPRLTTLILQFNNFEGQIPSSIGISQKLQAISLYSNKMSGSIPLELTTLPFLRIVYLGQNNLTGTIPPSVSNMTNLEAFGMEQNQIHGVIPHIEVGQLPNLKRINLQFNLLSGSIPPALLNISGLTQIVLSFNNLTGTLPTTTGFSLPDLEILILDENKFTGNIPLYLSNSSKLLTISLGSNNFTGEIPSNLGQLKFLQRFSVRINQLRNKPRSSKLPFLDSLTNCTSLQFLYMDDNPLAGVLPETVGNFSSSLQTFIASSCQLSGRIPRGIGFLRVNQLDLSNNNLDGTIPSTIASMEKLQRLDFGGNALQGNIPSEICLLSSLGEVNLSNNRLSGSIPSCIVNLTRLQKLSLDSNSLNSSLPPTLWSLENLLYLNLSSNSLVGSLDIRPLRALEIIDLSWNHISGEIPESIAAFQSLTVLNFSNNLLRGSIPESLGSLITLEYLDLSYNNLSSIIPKTLEALSRLQYLNLSSNKLSGEIPTGGPFKNFTMQSFKENGALCGKPNLQVPYCTTHTNTHKSRLNIILLCSLTIPTVLVFLFVLVMIRKYRTKHAQEPHPVDALPSAEQRFFSYQELRRATDNFSEANLLGTGSFGSVYKAMFSDGTIFAVKILNLQREGAFKSFDAECKVLRTVRHRNLVKVITSCSNPEFRGLVLQYMCNGSLENWLYSHKLDFLQRVSIMLDVATALEYLHHGHPEPIIHCDLKPSNILLDEHMVAHVGDFGIAKILAEDKIDTQTNTLGTLGYIAPEYGAEGRVSRKGDVYSYGVTLMETFTRKKPTDDMFAGELSLRKWVKSLLPNKLMKAVDSDLLATINRDGADMAGMEGHLVAIMELGLDCTAEFPDKRTDIKIVVSRLNKLKAQVCSS